jgi:hypothetical protein
MNAQQAGGYTNFERTQFMKFFSSREDWQKKGGAPWDFSLGAPRSLY